VHRLKTGDAEKTRSWRENGKGEPRDQREGVSWVKMVENLKPGGTEKSGWEKKKDQKRENDLKSKKMLPPRKTKKTGGT